MIFCFSKAKLSCIWWLRQCYKRNYRYSRVNRREWIIRVTRTENRKLLWQARFTRFRYFTFLSSVSSFYKYRLQDSIYSSSLFQNANRKEKENPGTLQFMVYSRSCCIGRHNLYQKIFYCKTRDQRIFSISNPRYTSSISSYAKDAIRYSWEKKTKLEKGYKEKQLKITNNLKQFSSETTTRRILQRSLKKHLSQLLHTETNEYRIYRERNIRRTVEEDR